MGYITDLDKMKALLQGIRLRGLSWNTGGYIYMDSDGYIKDEDGLYFSFEFDSNEILYEYKEEAKQAYKNILELDKLTCFENCSKCRHMRPERNGCIVKEFNNNLQKLWDVELRFEGLNNIEELREKEMY